MKRILSILLCLLISVPALSQQYLNARQLRLLNNTDSTGINSTTGIIRYDAITGKFRFYNAITGTWLSYAATSGPTTFNIGTAAETARTNFILSTTGGTANVPMLSYRHNSARVLADGYTDVWLGPNNGSSSASGGNIGIGNNNLTAITPGGSFTGTPWFSTFRGDRNIAIGFNAGKALTGTASNAATSNILLGHQILTVSTNASYNVFGGYLVAKNFTIPLSGQNGQSNVAFGNYIMQNVTSGTASHNVMFGPSVAYTATSVGSNNILIGSDVAELSNTIASSNTLIGPGVAENASIIGNDNTAIGDSGFRNVTWTTSSNTFNTAVGSSALRNSVEGSNQMTAVGTSAGRFAGGSDGTHVGRSAGWAISGTGNTTLGIESGFVSNNVYTGSVAAGTRYTGSNSTFIGYRSGYPAASAAVGNVIVIGNNFQPTLTDGDIYMGAPSSIKFVVDIDVSSLTVLTLTANGKIIAATLPTSCTGEASGTLWNDAGTLKVCP